MPLVYQTKNDDFSSFQLLQSWLGMRDSNPRMSAPKADALPLGESPVLVHLKNLIILPYLVHIFCKVKFTTMVVFVIIWP